MLYWYNTVTQRVNKKPGKPHWEVVKRIFRYLKETTGLKIYFKKDNNNSMIGYSDADWAKKKPEIQLQDSYSL